MLGGEHAAMLLLLQFFLRDRHSVRRLRVMRIVLGVPESQGAFAPASWVGLCSWGKGLMPRMQLHSRCSRLRIRVRVVGKVRGGHLRWARIERRSRGGSVGLPRGGLRGARARHPSTRKTTSPLPLLNPFLTLYHHGSGARTCSTKLYI